MFDQDCQAKYSTEPWKCFFVEHLLPFVVTPKMLVTHKYDIWQWWSDGLTPNILESLAIGEEAEWMAAKGQQLSSLLLRAYFFEFAESVFMSGCIFHSNLQFE